MQIHIFPRIIFTALVTLFTSNASLTSHSTRLSATYPMQTNRISRSGRCSGKDRGSTQSNGTWAWNEISWFWDFDHKKNLPTILLHKFTTSKHRWILYNTQWILTEHERAELSVGMCFALFEEHCKQRFPMTSPVLWRLDISKFVFFMSSSITHLSVCDS